MKDQARAKKLEKYAQRGRSGISLGVSQANGHRPGQEYETWGAPTGAQNSGEGGPQELNSAQDGKGKGGKAKGKGKDGKGKKAKGMERKGAARKAANLRRVDASSVGESTRRPSVPRTPSRKEVVSPKPENKGDTSRKKIGYAA